MTKVVELSDKAYKMLEKARREGESLSDPIIRSADIRKDSYPRRGETTISTTDGKGVVVGIVQDLCLGAGSCETLAPEAFALDRGQLGREPLGVSADEEKPVDLAKIKRATQSCPWGAIYLKDPQTGEEIDTGSE